MNEATIPAQYQPMLRAIQEMEPAAYITELVQGCHQVLNIGPSWGRDFYSLTQAGHHVFNLDVAVQPHLPRLVIANAAQVMPYPAKSFDAVVIAEVLEHIWNDFDALREARRVLKDDGRLVVTVPFFNDEPAYHVRIHSALTIHRLLQANGFEVRDYIERGGLSSSPRLVHGGRKLFNLLGQGESFTRRVIQFDRWLGHRRSRLLRGRPGYGCVVAAVKSSVVDFERLNATVFRH